MWPEPITFVGLYARLEPLAQRHHDDLVEAVADGELWDHWYTAIPRPEAMAAEIDRRLHRTEHARQRTALWYELNESLFVSVDTERSLNRSKDFNKRRLHVRTLCQRITRIGDRIHYRTQRRAEVGTAGTVENTSKVRLRAQPKRQANATDNHNR